MTRVLGTPIPDALARSAAAWGEAGARWLWSLPQRVEELVDLWSLTPELTLYLEGNCSLVLPVVIPDGTKSVLKVQWPHPEAEHEAAALRVYDGDGAVRLLEENHEHNALLLERCEPGASAWDAGNSRDILAISAEAMRRLWRPVSSSDPFVLLRADGAERAEKIRKRFVDYGRPFEDELARDGAAMFEQLGSTPPEQVLLHGDFHPDNVLSAEREPWLVIDPKPLVGDPAFDTAQLILNFYGRDWPMESTVSELANILELDLERVWGWVFARAVEEITWTLLDGYPIDDAHEAARLFGRLRL